MAYNSEGEMNILAPWIKGSAGTYERLTHTTGSISIVGDNFTTNSIISFESQFTTDGHAAGSLTWNSPTSLSLVVSASSQTGYYDMTVTNTDGLADTLTDGLKMSDMITINIDSNDKLSGSFNMKYQSIYAVGVRSGIVKTANTAAWDCATTTVAEITDGTSAYIEFKPTIDLDDSAHNWFMVGLAYRDNATTEGTNQYANIDYAIYCYSFGTTFIVYELGSGYESSDLDFSADRIFRVEIEDDTVEYRYSDDDGESWSDIYQSGTAVDIAGNGNLCGMVTCYQKSNAETDLMDITVIENIKMAGALDGVDDEDNGH